MAGQEARSPPHNHAEVSFNHQAWHHAQEVSEKVLAQVILCDVLQREIIN